MPKIVNCERENTIISCAYVFCIPFNARQDSVTSTDTGSNDEVIFRCGLANNNITNSVYNMV